MGLKSSYLEIENLSDTEINQMFNLMQRYYDNIKFDNFIRDLKEKNWVILLKNDEDKVSGFSTILLIDIGTKFSEKPVKLIFTGDTVVHEDHWGNLDLPMAFAKLAFIILPEKHPDHLMFWLLISKGYKTYRNMFSFTLSFYPKFDTPTPEFETNLMNEFGRIKYPGRYDPNAGVIHSDGTSDKVKEGVAELKEHHMSNPHLKFFAQKNPGYRQGDEMVCIASACPENVEPGLRQLITSIAS